MLRVALSFCLFFLVSPAQPPEGQVLGDKQHDIVIHRSSSWLCEDYRLGPDDAAVQVVEFADFQCPPCAAMTKIIKQLAQEFQAQVLFVFKNYPLGKACNVNLEDLEHDIYKFSCAATSMARCAGKYGKFWQYQDIAFAKQKEISDAAITAWAIEAGLSAEQVESCTNSDAIAEKIKDDVAQAGELGLRAVPTMFINGREYLGEQKVEAVRAAINALL